MEGSFETPYDPSSTVDNRKMNIKDRPSGVASAYPDLSSCATLSRVCSSSGLSNQLARTANQLAAIRLYNLTSFASLMCMSPFEVVNDPALDNCDCGHLLLVIAFWFVVLVQA